MLDNRIKYLLVLFIVLSLSMNAFSATNFTDDSSNDVLKSTDSVDEVDDNNNNNNNNNQANDNQGDDSQVDNSQADDGWIIKIKIIY